MLENAWLKIMEYANEDMDVQGRGLHDTYTYGLLPFQQALVCLVWR